MRNRQNYIKWASYGILMLILFLFQTSYGLRISLFGIRPDMLTFFLAAVALYEGPECAEVLGFFAGILCDMTHGGLDGLYPLYFIGFGMVAGFFAEKYFQRNIFSGIVLGALAAILKNLLKYLFYYTLMFNVSFSSGMRVIFTELLVSLLLSPAVYFVVRLIFRHFSEETDWRGNR